MAICFLDAGAVKGVQEYVNERSRVQTGITVCRRRHALRSRRFRSASLRFGRRDIRNTLESNLHGCRGFYIKGSEDGWRNGLKPVPPPWHQGLFGAMIRQILEVGGNLEMAFGYFWAVTRMLDVFRQLQNK